MDVGLGFFCKRDRLDIGAQSTGWRGRVRAVGPRCLDGLEKVLEKSGQSGCAVEKLPKYVALGEGLDSGQPAGMDDVAWGCRRATRAASVAFFRAESKRLWWNLAVRARATAIDHVVFSCPWLLLRLWTSARGPAIRRTSESLALKKPQSGG
jgi:hypothetical protein